MALGDSAHSTEELWIQVYVGIRDTAQNEVVRPERVNAHLSYPPFLSTSRL